MKNIIIKNKFYHSLVLYFLIVLSFILAVFLLKPHKSGVLDNFDITAGVELIKLKDGMTIILKNDPNAKTTAVRAYFRAGSIFESDYLGSGIGHLIEHMLFKGTDRYKVGEISKTMQSLGGQENAYTSFENVCYHVSVPAENSVKAVSIMANAVFHSSFDPHELEKETKVVLNELKMGDDDLDSSLTELFFNETYLRLPYKYPVIGIESILRGITRTDILDYYHKRFVPENSVFVCVGNFDRDQVIKAITDETARLIHRSSPDTAFEPEPEQLAFKYVEQFREDAVTTRLIAGYKTIGLLHSDLYALDLLSSMLGGGQVSVLNKIMKKEKGLVQDVSAFSYTPSLQGVFGFSLSLPDEKMAKATNELFRIIDHLPSYLKKSDMERVKKQVLADTIANLQTVEGQAARLGNDFVNSGDIHFSAVYAKRMSEVTLKDLERVWKRYFHKDAMTVTAIRPLTSKSTQQLAKKEGLKNLPMEKRILKNGLRIVFIEKKGLPLINMKFLTSGGLLLDSIPGIGRFVNEMILKGSKKYPGVSQFQKIESTGGWIANYYGNNSAGVTVNVLDRYLDIGLDVLFDSVQNALFSKKEFEALKVDTLQAIQNQNEDVFTEGINLLKKTMFGDHPYAYSRLGVTTAISQMKKSDAEKYYKDNYNSSNSVLVIVGDLSEKQKKNVMAKFSSFRRGNRKVDSAPEVIPLQMNKMVIKTNNKNRSIVLLAYPIPPLVNDSRYAIEVLDGIISGLGSRLFYQLRDIEHLGYNVGTTPVLLLKDGLLLFYIGTSKPLIEKAQQGLFREIGKFNTLTDEEMAASKKSLIAEYRKNSQAYDSLALNAGLFELYYDDIKLYDSYESKINDLSKEQILNQVSSIFSKPFGLVIMEGRAGEK